MTAIKNFIKKYWHGFFFFYFFLFMPYFFFIDNYTGTLGEDKINYMQCALDDLIPFCEYFVVPYILWYLYIFGGFLFLALTSRRECFRACVFIFSGMTIALLIFTIYPNGQNLRVNYDELGRSNIFVDWIKQVQDVDTHYAVFPSIHCINTIGMHIAIQKSNKITKYRKTIVISSFILSILIILSTVFTKQHSVIDIFGAFALAIPLYFLAYRPKYSFIKEF